MVRRIVEFGGIISIAITAAFAGSVIYDIGMAPITHTAQVFWTLVTIVVEVLILTALVLAVDWIREGKA